MASAAFVVGSCGFGFAPALGFQSCIYTFFKQSFAAAIGLLSMA